MTSVSNATTITSRTHRAKRALIAAAGVSSLGDGVYATAGPLAAAAVTRQPEMVALVAAAEYVPWVILSPYAGAYVDRWPKRRVMMAADAVRALLVGVVVWLAWTGSLTIPALVVLSLAIVSGSVFHDAASQAVIADVAEREAEALNRVNGHVSAATTAGRQMVGPSVGSALYAVAPWAPFAVDALSFAGSAALLTQIGPQPVPPRSGLREGVHAAIADGARFLLRHPLLRSLCLLLAAANLTYTMAWSTFVLYATSPQGLGLTAATFGLVVTTLSVGGLAGGLWAAPIIRRLGARGVVVMGLLIEAGVWALIASTHSPIVAGAALAVAGLCTSIVTVVAMSTRQQAAPPEMLARVVAAFRVVSIGASPVGAFLGGVLASQWGLHAPLWSAALILLVTVVVLVPAIRSFETPTP